MKIRGKRNLWLIFLLFFPFFNWHCLKSKRPGIPLAVQKVIRKAGLNRPELMKAIGYFVEDKDSLKLHALYSLMAQMDKNYSVYYSVQDTLGHHYFFNPEKYADYLALKRAWDSTEQIRGNLIYHADSFRVDAYSLSGDFLMRNINEAFSAWRTFPWAKKYGFKQFCHYILPYRVANEPVEDFRKYFIREYGPLPKRFYNDHVHTIDVASYINRLVNKKIGYKDTYNKCLDVQTIRHLEKTGYGNFYDINVYKVKVLRAFGIAAALDYTPFLADTNFGYAYTTVILPDSNELILEYPKRVNLQKPGRLAKLYRRTFFRDSASLYTIKKIQRATPPFLGDFYYSDITNAVSSFPVWVGIQDTARYVYLSVFNDGGWRPVSWARVRDSAAFFRKTGKDIIYLPVSYHRHMLMREGTPFLLDNNGIKHFLKADFSVMQQVTLRKTSPWSRLVPGENYTLYFWDGNWKTLTSFTAGRKGITLSLPVGALFFLTNDDIDFNERIFLVNEFGKQQFY